MNQVIVYTNSTGTVSVCTPTNESDINNVLAQDCPAGAVIIDSSALPQGSDSLFQSAWVLNGLVISIDFPKAQSQQTSTLNSMVYNENAHRAVKTLSGIANVLPDADWKTLVTNAQFAIATATTTEELVAAVVPVQEAIAANAAI